MPRARFNPSLNKALIRKSDGLAFYRVNAFAVRNEAQPDEEFTNFANRDDFPHLIPEGEVWIAEKIAEREADFFIADAVARTKAFSAGASEAKAYTVGLNAERKLRAKETGMDYRSGRPHRRIPAKTYVSAYVELPDPVRPTQVFLVDGLVVRSTYKTDYAEGGHGYVYQWVPKGEIWIDSAITPAEIPFILAHEYTELRLMRDLGYEYDRAHEIASKVEFALRKQATRAEYPGFGRRKPHKSDVKKLTSEEYFEFVQNRYCRGVLGRLGSKIANLAGMK
jgi:hypothetical protein